MTEADVILTSQFAPVPQSVLSQFERPTRAVALPVPPSQHYQQQVDAFGQQPIRGILKTYAPDVKPLRVAVMGFSESCQFPRAILRSKDGGRIDSAFAVDGIHAQYVQGTKNIAPGYLEAWIAFAKEAATNGRLLAVTTSSIVPSFVSTTETSDAIWRAVTDTDDDVQSEPADPTLWDAALDPPVTIHSQAGGTTVYDQLPSRRYRRVGTPGGLVIYNYSDLDGPGTNDHILQAQVVLPRLLSAYLVPRWNAIEPKSGICTFAGEFMGFGAGSCFFPTAFPDDYMDGGAKDDPLDLSAPPVGVGGTSSARASFFDRVRGFVEDHPVLSAGLAAGAAGVGLALRGRRTT